MNLSYPSYSYSFSSSSSSSSSSSRLYNFILSSEIWINNNNNIDDFDKYHNYARIKHRQYQPNFIYENFFNSSHKINHFIENGYIIPFFLNILEELYKYYDLYRYNSSKFIQKGIYPHLEIEIKAKERLTYYERYKRKIKFLSSIFHLSLIERILDKTYIQGKSEVVSEYTNDIFFSLHFLVDFNLYSYLYSALIFNPSSCFSTSNSDTDSSTISMLKKQNKELKKNKNYYNDYYFENSFDTLYSLDRDVKKFVEGKELKIGESKRLRGGRKVMEYTHDIANYLLDISHIILNCSSSFSSSSFSASPTTSTSAISSDISSITISTISSSSLAKNRFLSLDTSHLKYVHSNLLKFKLEGQEIFSDDVNIFFLVFSSTHLSISTIYFILPYLSNSFLYINDFQSIFSSFFLENEELDKLIPIISDFLPPEHLNSIVSRDVEIDSRDEITDEMIEQEKFGMLSSIYLQPIFTIVSSKSFLKKNKSVNNCNNLKSNLIEELLKDDNFLLLFNRIDKKFLFCSFISFYNSDKKFFKNLDGKLSGAGGRKGREEIEKLKEDHNYFKRDIYFIEFNHLTPYISYETNKMQYTKYFSKKYLLHNENIKNNFLKIKLIKSNKKKNFNNNKDNNYELLFNFFKNDNIVYQNNFTNNNPNNTISYLPSYYNNYNLYNHGKNLLSIFLSSNYFNMINFFILLNYYKKKFFFYKEVKNIFINPGAPMQELFNDYYIRLEDYRGNRDTTNNSVTVFSYWKSRNYCHKLYSSNRIFLDYFAYYFLCYYDKKVNRYNLKNANENQDELLLSHGFGTRNHSHIILFDELIINRNILSLELLVYFSYFLVFDFHILKSSLVPSTPYTLENIENTDQQLNFIHLTLIFRNKKFSLNHFTYLLFILSRRGVNFNEFILEQTKNIQEFTNLPKDMSSIDLSNLINNENKLKSQKKTFFSNLFSTSKSTSVIYSKIASNILEILTSKDIYEQDIIMYLLNNSNLNYKHLFFLYFLLKRLGKFEDFFNKVRIIKYLNHKDLQLSSIIDTNDYYSRKEKFKSRENQINWMYPINKALIGYYDKKEKNYSFNYYFLLFNNRNFFINLFKQKKKKDQLISNYFSSFQSFVEKTLNQLFLENLDSTSPSFSIYSSHRSEQIFYVNNMSDSFDEFLSKFLYDKKKFHPFYLDSDSDYYSDDDKILKDNCKKNLVNKNTKKNIEIELNTREIEMKNQVEIIEKEELEDNDDSDAEKDSFKSQLLTSKKEKKLLKLLNLNYQNKNKLKKHLEVDLEGDFKQSLEPIFVQLSYYDNYFSFNTNSYHICEPPLFISKDIISDMGKEYLEIKGLYRDLEDGEAESLFSKSLSGPKDSKEDIEYCVEKLLDEFLSKFDEQEFYHKFRDNYEKFFEEIEREFGEDNKGSKDSLLKRKYTQIFDISFLSFDEEKEEQIQSFYSNLSFILDQLFNERTTENSGRKSENKTESDNRGFTSFSSLRELFKNSIINDKIFSFILPYLTSSDYMNLLPGELRQNGKQDLLFTSEEFFDLLKHFISNSIENRRPQIESYNYYESLNIVEKYFIMLSIFKNNKRMSSNLFYNLFYLNLSFNYHSVSTKNQHLKNILKLFFLMNHDKKSRNLFFVIINNLYYNLVSSSSSYDPRLQFRFYNQLLLLFYYYLIFFRFFHENKEKLSFFFKKNYSTEYLLWKQFLLFNKYKEFLIEDHLKVFLNILNNLTNN